METSKARKIGGDKSVADDKDTKKWKELCQRITTSAGAFSKVKEEQKEGYLHLWESNVDAAAHSIPADQKIIVSYMSQESAQLAKLQEARERREFIRMQREKIEQERRKLEGIEKEIEQPAEESAGKLSEKLIGNSSEKETQKKSTSAWWCCLFCKPSVVINKQQEQQEQATYAPPAATMS